MNKGQISFAVAGVIFGFLVGFVAAHQLYVGRGEAAFQHPPVAPGTPRGGGAPGAGANGAPPADGGTATMEAVQQEIASLTAILEKDPKNLQALVRMGNLYFDVGMFEQAAGFYQRALEVDPDDIMVQTDLGTSLRRLGKPRQALGHFQAAVAADPTHWRGWFNIGVVSLYDLGEFKQAEEAFARVDQLNPGSIDMTALREEIARIKAEGAGSPGAGG